MVPRQVSLPGEDSLSVDRDTFYEWLWSRFSEEGLLGVHEGTLLSDEAAEQGFETDSWTVDSGEAPRERDWVSRQAKARAEVFFASFLQAEQAIAFLRSIPEIQVEPVEEQKPQDWDAEWKASFLNAGAGVPIPPFWKVVPPWVEKSAADRDSHEKLLKINPGAGFGTGTHETTQLCLEAMGDFSQLKSLQGMHALDFGSGSGILSIGLALLGLQVDAVEIDSLAVDNALENSELNEVQKQIRFSSTLPTHSKSYDIVIANILKPVLLEFSGRLVQRLKKGGVLILSGLIEGDVSPVVAAYSELLKVPVRRIYEKNEWRALTFVK
jgi:ribosomal protein L11 methyltransferase